MDPQYYFTKSKFLMADPPMFITVKPKIPKRKLKKDSVSITASYCIYEYIYLIKLKYFL